MTTSSLQNSIVKDMGLASEGHLKIDWVEAHILGVEPNSPSV